LFETKKRREKRRKGKERKGKEKGGERVAKKSWDGRKRRKLVGREWEWDGCELKRRKKVGGEGGRGCRIKKSSGRVGPKGRLIQVG
jgi:hypothetical protein